MGQATVLAYGGVTVSASGGQSGDALFRIQQQLSAASAAGTLVVNTPPATTVVGTKASPILIPQPSAPGSGTVQVITIPDADTGYISVPAGYTTILYNGPGTIIAGPGQQVIGDLFATGGASTVIGGGIGGRISDTTSGAFLGLLSGNYTINSQGDAQTVEIQNKVKFNLNLTGSGNTVNIGLPNSTVASQLRGSDFATVSGNNDTINMWAQENATFIVQPGATGTVFNSIGNSYNPGTIVTLLLDNGASVTAGQGNLIVYDSVGTALTFDGSGNSALTYIFDSVGGGHITPGDTTLYVNDSAAAAASITGHSGSNDTVYAFHGVNYDGTQATSLLLVGGTDASTGANTVAAAANTTIWGGAAGGTYSIGGGSFFFGGAAGASDTLVESSLSGSGSSFFAYSNSNEQLTLTSVTGASGNGVNLVVAGDQTTVDATNGAGGDNIWLLGISASTVAGANALTGAATINGATAGGEHFVLYMDNTVEAAHTITVNNWQGSDNFDLLHAVGTGSDNYLQADVAAISAFNAGASGNSFTLSDGTTVTFQGGQPTHITLF